jgi:SAM-dependent methyltransferase
MSSPAEHYERLLAEHYVWMFGVPFEAKVAEQKQVIEQALGDRAHVIHRGVAIDLGSGPGFQSIALSELGYSPVIAVDTSRALLTELESRRRSAAIQTIEADITKLDSLQQPMHATLIVCMGDTLTHLPTKSAVSKLFADVHQRLTPGGLFLLTYRDLTRELEGVDRFLPVQADDSRIMTCFLEFSSPDTVTVHDIVHVRENGVWIMKKSSYPKLRLASAWIGEGLRAAGFTEVREQTSGRMLLTIAAKQDSASRN